MRSGRKIFILGNCSSQGIDWNTSDTHGGKIVWRFRFLECVKEDFLYRHVSEVTKLRGEDVPLQLGLVFTLGSLKFENITYGPPLTKSDHLVLKMDYIVRGKVLKA